MYGVGGGEGRGREGVTVQGISMFVSVARSLSVGYDDKQQAGKGA